MATKSRLRVRAATQGDIKTMADIHFAAFADNIMNQLMYPRGVSEDCKTKFELKLMPAVPAEETTPPRTQGFVCVVEYLPQGGPSDRPGEIIAYAKWRLQREQQPEEEWKGKELHATTETWGDVCDVSVVNAFMGEMDRAQQQHAKGEAALYLSLLACDPTRQRSGAGSALMQWGVNLADSLGLPCRVESSPAAYALYKKFGYEDVAVLDMKVTENWGASNTNGSYWGENNAVDLAGPVPKGVQRTVIMRRPPRNTTATDQFIFDFIGNGTARDLVPFKSEKAASAASLAQDDASTQLDDQDHEQRRPSSWTLIDGQTLSLQLDLVEVDGCDRPSGEMDPLSAAANIISIIHTAVKVPATLEALSRDHGPIEGCKKVILELEKALPHEAVFGSDSKRTAIKSALSWFLKESKAKSLLHELREYKRIIALALTTDSSLDIKETKANTEKIYAIITADEQERNIYNWLCATDPSDIHERSCEAYEPGTGDWLFRDPVWEAFTEEKTRCLWIHGIPGAGKTIFASHLFQATHRYRGPQGLSSGYVYYYCYFGHAQDETVPFLRWVIFELCRQLGRVPLAVHELHRRGSNPTAKNLLAALADFLPAFGKVFVVIDALDESLEREKLLRVLRELASDSRFENLRLLATSREYADIEEAMTEVAVPISMQNPFLDDDIRLYVQSKLDTHPRFKRWRADLRREVANALSAKANGMFRWVVCQLDSLQRLKPESKVIQTALANLPKSLDETYERVFMSIPEDARLFVQQVLWWMSTHRAIHQVIPGVSPIATVDISEINVPRGADIPFEVLFAAVERGLQESDDPNAGLFEGYMFDEELLREYCGCLVTPTTYTVRPRGRVVDDIPTVAFAHYTVLEFLESRRIRSGPAAFFSLHREQALADHAVILLNTAVASVERWDEEIPEMPGIEMYSDFDRYCAQSSVVLLHWHTDTLLSSGTLAWLTPAVELVRVRAPTMGSLFWYPPQTHFKLENPISPAITAFIRANGLTLLEPAARPELETLARMLQVEPRGRLARAYLESLDRTSADLSCQIDLEFQPGVCFHRRGELCPVGVDAHLVQPVRFRGSVLEFFAQLPAGTWAQPCQALSDVLDYFSGHFDPSVLLVFAIVNHHHVGANSDSPTSPCWGCKVIQRLLQLGAKATPAGYAVSALQVAAALRDARSTKILLEAGIDPNAVGDGEHGEIGTPDRGPLLEAFEVVKGRSALNIVNGELYVSMRTRNVWVESVVGDEWTESIEDVLARYGAKDFMVCADPDEASVLTTEMSILTITEGDRDSAVCVA
ncbi:uncharacterized protein C8A04DRAFT_11560 [Dichotomopilus funicola]|uniref:NACHT domain-containing protein n=1 Tax=Dichotomopilus funicola TaxID=1934379 RepID=A0AAN6V5I5_9PEZI|nr:hypothetical protein C8A04DRAFT_11560 [Dichotomopilus funicola]